MSQKCLSKGTLYKRIWSKGTLTKQGWINSGWVKVPVKPEDEHLYKAKPTIHHEESFSNKNSSEMDMFQDIQNEIQYGMAGDKIDELPGLMRQLFDASDIWHINKKNQLFRIVDPEIQARDGEWGSDSDDSDIETLKDRPSTSRVFLEQSGILPVDASQNSVMDILGNIDTSESIYKQMESSSYNIRTEIDVDRTSISPEEAAISIIDNDTEEKDTSSIINTDDNDIVCFKDPRMMNTALPNLPKEVLAKVNKLKEELDVLLSKTTDDSEKERLALIFEYAVDKEVNVYLTAPINSPLCARGYSQPKRKYEFIDVQKGSSISDAAAGRVEFFNELFKEASDCSSYRDLCGTYQSNGGFYGKIRNMYAHDKELSNKWSINDRTDTNGDTVISAFNKQRQEFIRKWREENKGDEESLRIAVWAIFDRVAGEQPAIRKKGKLTKPSRHYKDSIWRQDRTAAFEKLFLTLAQWNAIYKMTGIISNRIKLNNDYSKNRDEILKIMEKHFIRIQNLSDLNSYMQWISKREFIYNSPIKKRKIKLRTGEYKEIDVIDGLKYNTYKFKPSMIDQISIKDEMKTKQSCARKRKYLTNKLLISQMIVKSIKEIQETDLPEMSISCDDPKCECMTVGKPQFARINNDKGYLFVRCEVCKDSNDKSIGCNKLILLVGYKDKVEAMTKEEAIAKFKENNNA